MFIMIWVDYYNISRRTDNNKDGNNLIPVFGFKLATLPNRYVLRDKHESHQWGKPQRGQGNGILPRIVLDHYSKIWRQSYKSNES